MKNTKYKKARFEKIFGDVSPAESDSLIVEVEGIIKRSSTKNLDGNRYYFLQVEKCPICNNPHSYHHLDKDEFIENGVLNLFTYEITRNPKCYPENVFSLEQIEQGYKIPDVRIRVDLTQYKEIIKHIFRGET